MTDEQQALVKKARESVRAAQVLAAAGYPDFAISRAYYAMFYIAEAFLLGIGIAHSKHSGVISAFGRYFVRSGQIDARFHRYLIEGQNSRIQGDYDVGPPQSIYQAHLQIERAEEFLSLAESLP